MKVTAKKLFSMLLVVAVFISTFAVTALASGGEEIRIAGDPLTYTVFLDDTAVYVSDCEPGQTVVTIPSTVEGYPVTVIDGMFNGYASLETLIFAGECQIETIWNSFNNCVNLKEIVWGNTDSATKITKSFRGCASLEELTIPAYVEEIGQRSFEDCINLKTLTFAQDSQLKAIREEAFAYTGKDNTVAPATIANLSLPASLETLEENAFRGIPVKHFALEDNSKLTEIPAGFLSVFGVGSSGYPGRQMLSSYPYTYEFVRDPAQLAVNCLETIDFGENNRLGRIGSGAFKNQSHVKTIDFGTSDADLTIDGGAFNGVGNNGYMVEQGVDAELNCIETLIFPANLVAMKTETEWTYDDYSYTLNNNAAFAYACIKNIVFSDNCRLSSIPDGFMGINGHGNHGYPGQERTGDWSNPVYEFVSDLTQIAANSLETIDFGENNSLTSIGCGAFYNQSHLTAIDFGTSTAPLSINSGAFVGVGNNGYLVEQGVDEKLNAGIETLVFPANLVSLQSGFEYARIKNITFADNCQLTSIPSSFMGIIGYGNNGYPGQERTGTWDEPVYEFIHDLTQIAANGLETIDFGKNNSLTNIGWGAFYNQSHVTAIDFGTSTAPLTINNGAFIGVGNNGYLVDQGVDETLNAGIETLVFPANLVSLQSGFEYARIKNLVFSDNCKVMSIPNSFMGIIGPGCNGYPGKNRTGTWENPVYEFVNDSVQIAANSLETIDFGENNCLASINNGAFYNQSHVTAIDFGTSEVALTIYGGTFIGVGNNGYLVDQGVDENLSAGIETLVFPANLTAMDSGAFEYACIKNIAFADNCRLTSIPRSFMGVIGHGSNGHPGQKFISGEWSDFETFVHEFVYDSAQIAANSLETIDFGKNNSLRSVEWGAFYNQSHMTAIDFGTSSEALTIYGGSFIGVGNNGYLYEQGVDKTLHAGIETLVFPANLIAMESGSFDLSHIKNMVFSDDCRLKGIGDGFMQVPGENGKPRTEAVYVAANNLKSVDFGENNSLETIGNGAFTNQSNLTTINFGANDTLKTIGGGAFVGNKSLKTLDLSKTEIETIAYGVFSYCGATKIILPDTLTTLDDGAFQNLTRLEMLVIGSDCQLTELTGGVFSNCENLTTVNLLNSNITTIGDSLKENEKLTQIVFPKNLKSIEWEDTSNHEICPFYGCGNVSKLRFAAVDTSDYQFTEGVFQFLNESGTVHVPAETTDAAIQAYKTLLEACGLSFETGKWNIQVVAVSDMEKAGAVEDLISDLPALDQITLENKDAIEEVYSAYQSLTEDQKDMLDAELMLELLDATEKIEELEQQKVNHEKADAVENQINDLPSLGQITLADKQAVKDAYDAYQNLTEEQKNLVDTSVIQDLLDAVEKIDELEKNGNQNDKPVYPFIPVDPPVVTPVKPADKPTDKPESVELPFTDVAAADWYYDAVRYAYENGLMKGMTTTSFVPGATTTRGMLVTILYRLENEPATYGQNGFRDVKTGAWYADAVVWAAANGIVNGYGDIFGAEDAVTREQFVTILYRYAQCKGYAVSAKADLSVYSDAEQISGYAVEAMQWAVAKGIISGRTPTSLAAKGTATRAEMATILMRFIESNR